MTTVSGRRLKFCSAHSFAELITTRRLAPEPSLKGFSGQIFTWIKVASLAPLGANTSPLAQKGGIAEQGRLNRNDIEACHVKGRIVALKDPDSDWRSFPCHKQIQGYFGPSFQRIL